MNITEPKHTEQEQLHKLSTSILIRHALEEIKDILQSKNESYGDSLDNGVDIFTTDTSIKVLSRKQYGICCRIDDKLARIKQVGITPDTLDTLDDIIGYLIRLKITFSQS